MKKKTWVEAAINGAWTRAKQPAIPLAPDEIISEAIACAHAGASIVHYHAYDPETGQQTASDLIRMYQADGERYIFIPKFKQTCRYINSKYPEPPEQISDINISIDEKGKVTVTPKTCLSNAQVSRREVKRREEKINISTKNLSLGKPIPDDFAISEEVRQWFSKQKGVYNLEAHFQYFVSQAKSKAYESADWD